MLVLFTANTTKKTQGRPWWGGDHICIYIHMHIIYLQIISI
jgi:hypothetical protein